MSNKAETTLKEIFEKINKKEECQLQGVCAWCGSMVGQFRDRESVREWEISGLCQKCQDEVFGE